MSNIAGWFGRFALLALAAAATGSLVSALPFLHTSGQTLFGLPRADAIRLLIDLGAWASLLVMAWKGAPVPLASEAGWSFLQRILRPLTVVVVLLLAVHTLRTAGQPVITAIGGPRYIAVMAMALLGVTLWLTIRWSQSFDDLVRACSPRQASTKTPRPATAKPSTADAPKDDLSQTSAAGGPPPMLGRYKILKELGRGAMGVVYLGKDPTIQRFVAIKTMCLDEADSAEDSTSTKARFFGEAESAGRLSHPHIVTIYDAGEAHNLGYIAMEVLEGATLKDWTTPTALLPVEKVLSIMANVADALHYAHQQGVIHRDIKPANIMMTKDQVVKVMDFGIAKMAYASKTQTDIVLGTPTYMSPEQIAGKKIDGRSDVFSLGVVMYELLTGIQPFSGDTLPALLFAITNHPHRPLHEIRPDLPSPVLAIIDRALEKEPARRYRRAGDMAQDLRACLQLLPA